MLQNIFENKIAFLVLKRMYEKVFPFNESAQTLWMKVFKMLSYCKGLAVSYRPVLEWEERYLERLRSLLKDTRIFLIQLRAYLCIQSEEKNQRGSYEVSALLEGDELFSFVKEWKGRSSLDTIAGLQPSPYIPFERRIFLQDEEYSHKQSSRHILPIHGSRDWNRLRLYYFEVTLKELGECVSRFDSCYFLNVDPERLLHQPYSLEQALAKKGEGKTQLPAYEQMEKKILDEIANLILNKDFPGMKEPQVFLYHCSPAVLYRLLLQELKSSGLGFGFYVEEDAKLRHAFPEAFVKKIFMDWFKDRFSKLETEKVDSYLLYSQQMERLRRTGHRLYREKFDLQKKEKPRTRLRAIERWILDNRDQVYGDRRNLIFLRFNI